MVITENSTIYFMMVILCPLIGLLINLLFFARTPRIGSRFASMSVWIGFMSAGIAWFVGLPFSEKSESWGLIANEVSWVMATLILFVSAIVHHFSLRYMEGDRNYRRYFISLSTLTVSTLLMVAADNIIMFISFWAMSNAVLVSLMVHKHQWEAAKNSGLLAMKTFLAGLFFLSCGTGLLAYETGTLSLSLIAKNSESLPTSIRIFALLCITLAAFSQSGGWPFHGWLISSLNSPTPVSAFMHAGLVNGGGLLLIRFASTFLHESYLLNILFVLSVVTLILGGVWKLLQTDIKRMLACSTMTQMGFMMMQCGLGLFPAALAHLCWHSLFKAFLFLRSGSSVAEHRPICKDRLSTAPTFLLSSLCGLMGAVGFILGSDIVFNFYEATTVLFFFSWMASTQLAHVLLEKKQTIFVFIFAGALCLTAGLIYGLTVGLIETAVAPMQISKPEPLHFIHIIAIALISVIWLRLNLKPFTSNEGSPRWRMFYVRMLNASQPSSKTTTTGKKVYQF